MLLLFTNKTTGSTRYETWHDRQYIVAPLTLVVEGTLFGNEGPFFYPGSEISKHPSTWNGIPIVVYPESYHPKANGKYITARDPQTLIKSEIGRIFNAESKVEKDGIVKLVAEGWFDVDLTKKIDIRVYNALTSQQQMELSTGLGGDVLAASDGSKDQKGRPYSYIACNFRPDHVAILPDKRGACSIADGCGIYANSTTNQYEWIVNPKGAWTPPESGNAPAEIKRILKAVYTQYRDKHPAENAATKAKGAKLAWGAVRRAGWTKNKSGKWVKRKKTVQNVSHEPTGDNMPEPTRKRQAPLWKKLGKVIARAIGIVNQPSHDDIRSQLCSLLEERFGPSQDDLNKVAQDVMGYSSSYGDTPSNIYVVDVFDKYVVYNNGSDLYKLGYTTDLRTNQITLSDSDPVEVVRKVDYKPVANTDGSPPEPKVTPPVVETPPNPEPVVSPITEPVVPPVVAEVPKPGTEWVVTTTITNSEAPPNTKPPSVFPPEKTTTGEPSMPLTPEQKQQIITNLSTGCKCHTSMPWKSLTADQLKALSDDTLTAYDATRVAVETVTNSTPAPTPVVTPTPTPVVTPTLTPTVVTAPIAPPVLNRLTPDEQEAIAFANEERHRRHQELVDRMTVSITDPAQKQSAATIYANMKPKELAQLVSLLPAPTQPDSTTYSGVNWLPAAGPAIVNTGAVEEPLAEPQYNWTN